MSARSFSESDTDALNMSDESQERLSVSHGPSGDAVA
jgi:hypothetical protein